MSTQYIRERGRKAYAVVPIAEYEALREKAELHDDLSAYARAREELDSGNDEIVPDEVAEALLSGASPLKVWRTYRGLSQQQLASACEISQAYLAQIERGQREGTLAVYRRLAEALTLSVDDLLTHTGESRAPNL